MEKTCRSCGSFYRTRYCGSCGEKSLEEDDFRLGKILGDGIEALTNLDSRFLRSFKLLIINPAKLSRNYIEGIRVPYMKPFQIFLIANLVFFIFLGDFDIFRTPSKWLFNDSFEGYSFPEKVREIMALNNETYTQVALRYDKLSSDLSKSLLIFITPVIGFIFMLLSFRFKKAFAKHYIVGLHYFSILLLVFTFIYGFFQLIDYNSRLIFIGAILLFITLYTFLIFFKFYRDHWALAIFKSIAGLVLIFWCFQVYKWTINFLSLCLL